MISREYDKRISIFGTVKVPDGYGGNTVTEELVSSSWAKIDTNGVGYKMQSIGLDQFNNPVLFKVRFRSDLVYTGRTMYVLYAGIKYIIQGIRNADQRNIELEIYCTKLDE